ncbi:hypothetical protein MBANPS3_012126, partial [Mucor bainieri]
MPPPPPADSSSSSSAPTPAKKTSAQRSKEWRDVPSNKSHALAQGVLKALFSKALTLNPDSNELKKQAATLFSKVDKDVKVTALLSPSARVLMENKRVALDQLRVRLANKMDQAGFASFFPTDCWETGAGVVLDGLPLAPMPTITPQQQQQMQDCFLYFNSIGSSFSIFGCCGIR